MILERVTITGFRSISGTQDLFVDRFVTVLIGANDHGKTNLLEATRALNDDYDIKPSDRNWDTNEPDAPKIEWTFSLTPEEVETLLLKATQLRAEQESASLSSSSGAEDEESEEEEPDSTPVATGRAATKPLPAVADSVDEDEEDLDDAEQSEPAPLVTDAVLAAIRSLQSLKFVKAGVDTEVAVELSGTLKEHAFVAEYLLETRPRIELFTGTTKILDSITLADLEQPESEFMQGIFRKAEIWDERATLFEINPRTRKRLADASQVLTTRIRQEWQQGKDLVFHLGHGGSEGNRIDVSIEDPSVQRQYVQPTQRSTGFSAFFGMSMALFARKEASPANNYIFIFDEPATALHPHGQVNVQRVFETLSRKNQIAYTTHSIFMVNKNYPPRNRAVTKTDRGTLVDHKPYIGNWKAVRSNLGLIFSNNFFVADTTLLVEGPSDEVYIASLLRTCDRLGLVDVDLNLFSIRDAGNSVDMVAMGKLMADEGRRVVAMVDGDAQGTNTKKRIEQVNGSLLKDGVKVEVLALPKGKSTEDIMLYPELLREAVAKAATELVSAGIRKLKEGLAVDSLRGGLDAGLKEAKEVTLGRAIQDVTKGWFEGDDEPVSKLHIARIYDELVEALPDTASKPTKAELTAGKDLAMDLLRRLKLPEKMASESVVE